jgi:hypothetical protein
MKKETVPFILFVRHAATILLYFILLKLFCQFSFDLKTQENEINMFPSPGPVPLL